MATIPLVLGGLSVSVSADDGFSIFKNIEVKGEIRPRYESADIKDNNKDAGEAFTARTSLVATAGLFEVENLTATVGIISVNNFGSDQYNSSLNGKTQYDIVADPQQAMMSDAAVDYKVAKTALHAGRSKVNLDNQRFIGTVGWRQLERSYDTLYIADNSIENLSLLAAWVYGFQGVVGTAASTTQDTNSVLLHVNYKVMDELSITAYDYMLADIHDTMGIALTGNINAGAKLDYRVEYATQGDASMNIHGGAKAKADATYMNFDLGANISGVLAGINYEVLSGTTGSDGKTNFNPALGTNHKFNGWADIFYVGNTGPAGGLKDANVRLGYTAPGFGKLLAFYHDFKAETNMANGDDLGSEIDVLYTNKIPGVKDLTGLVKYASYSKGQVTNYANATLDKQVAWVGLDYTFSIK